MRLTYEDKASIKLVHQQKGWGAKRICKEFPNKSWVVISVKDLLRKIDKTNSISRPRKVGSRRNRTVRITQNIELVVELICSQEDNRGSSKSPREIQKLTGISRTSVRRIAKRDLQLKVFRRKKAHLLSASNHEKRVKCCKMYRVAG